MNGFAIITTTKAAIITPYVKTAREAKFVSRFAQEEINYDVWEEIVAARISRIC